MRLHHTQKHGRTSMPGLTAIRVHEEDVRPPQGDDVPRKHRVVVMQEASIVRTCGCTKKMRIAGTRDARKWRAGRTASGAVRKSNGRHGTRTPPETELGLHFTRQRKEEVHHRKMIGKGIPKRHRQTHGRKVSGPLDCH